MKKHNTLKVVLITLLTFLVLSWIFTSAYYSNGYVEQGRIQMGLFDAFFISQTAISFYFGYIAFICFLLLVCSMVFLNHISAYRVMIDKLAKSFKGKEKNCFSCYNDNSCNYYFIYRIELGTIVSIPIYYFISFE